LIVGGGPVGLTTSILLSHHGIRSLLIEQHPGTSIYPKARFINARTMEIFRQLGMEAAMRAVEIPATRNVVWARSLAGEELARRPVETMIREAVQVWSPTWGCTSTQETFELVLLAEAQRRPPASLRFHTQLVTFQQTDDHILATLLDRPSGREQQVRARYLVGADGAHSRVRETLGIRMQGESVLTHSVNILFRADLASFVGDREINICFITNPQAAGLLLYNGGDRWRFTAFYFPERGERAEDYTPERCLQIVRGAVGVPDVPLELDGTFPWSDAALVAERFGDHRAFLTGDAEHLMAPAGGFGMSVGIQDAHNLSWKLAGVLQGWAAPALLASYEAERAPISRGITEQMRRNALAARGADRTATAGTPAQSQARPALGRPEFFREHGLVFGATYAQGALVPDGTPLMPVSNPVTDYVPTARPGCRAPHVWLQQGDRRISTLDLFGRHFVLLTGQEGKDWCQAAERVGVARRIGLQPVHVAHQGEWQDPERAWAATYGVEDSGAVLVRPDGYVAWRGAHASDDPQAELDTALAMVLGWQPAGGAGVVSS
jgi:putative polyketide hydroxylase